MLNKVTLAKVAGGLLVDGGIAGAGTAYALNSSSPVTKVKEQLEKDNKKLLSDSAKDRWEIKLNTYITELKSNNSEIILGSSDTWENLKSWCEEKIKKDFNKISAKVYAGIQKICTVPTNTEKFKKASKTLAGSDDWAGKKTLYQSEGTGTNTIEGISKDNIKDGDGIKAWCETEVKKEYVSEDNDYNRVVKWCTK